MNSPLPAGFACAVCGESIPVAGLADVCPDCGAVVCIECGIESHQCDENA